MKKILLIIGGIVLIVLILFFLGTKPAPQAENVKGENVTNNAKQWDKAPDMKIDSAKNYSATILTTKGDMVVELFAKDAPNTVNNFIFLSQEKFYDNVKFHRIIKGFMIQTGDPTGTGTGGPGYKFNDEPVTRDYQRGMLAMANSGPNTNGSQFFIMHADNLQMAKNYTIFGQIAPTDTASLKTLDAIAQTPVTTSASGEDSTPQEDVIIKTVTITEK